MEAKPKIKLPIPYDTTEKDSKIFKKIEAKLETLNKTGTEKTLTFIGSSEVAAMFYLYLFKKYKSKCFIRNASMKKRILGMTIEIKTKYNPNEMQEIENQLDDLLKN